MLLHVFLQVIASVPANLQHEVHPLELQQSKTGACGGLCLALAFSSIVGLRLALLSPCDQVDIVSSMHCVRDFESVCRF